MSNIFSGMKFSSFRRIRKSLFDKAKFSGITKPLSFQRGVTPPAFFPQKTISNLIVVV